VYHYLSVPAAESFADVLADTKHMASANQQLTSMGFSAKEGWQPAPISYSSP
jgi:hypothetical protein